jgi:hypothetical protein
MMGQAMDTMHDAASWRGLFPQAAAYVHPRRIVDAFGGVIGDDVAVRLAEETRFRDRLSALLAGTFALSEDFGDGVPSHAALKLGRASSADLSRLVRQCGAVYWARAIVGVIEAKSVVTLQQTLGDDAYAAALAHRDLATPDPTLPARDDLDPAVSSAGFRCLAAWCALQPPAFAQRLRLKFPDQAELDEVVAPPFDIVGPPIVDRLAKEEQRHAG